MEKKAKKLPIREVGTLPREAILNEVIFNKKDRCFYIGVEAKEAKENGSHMEKTSV